MFINQVLKISFIAFMLTQITGCSLFSPAQSDVQTYVLNTYPNATIQPSHHRKVVMIQQPESNSIYNSTQIPYIKKQHEIAYFAKNQWAEAPAKMLQSLIIQTLQHTQHYKAVVSPSYMGVSDYSLNSQLLALEQDFLYSPSIIRLKFQVQLVNIATGRIVGTKLFYITEPTQQNTPYAGVVAANLATAEMLKELERFCLANIR